MADGKSWREVRDQLALNEARVATYRRLMDAQEAIALQLLGQGLVSEEQIDQALSASQADDPVAAEEDGVYLSALTRYVSALGGRLEISAVFGDARVSVQRRDQIPGADAG